MILSWKCWWKNFHDEIYSIFDFPDIPAFNQYDIYWVFETLWLCLCVRYCHRQTIADIILTSSPSQQYVVCGVLCDPGMIGPWKFWTDALMTCRLNPSGSRGRVKIDCVSTLTNCVRPTTILMAGQLVIRDASEDGGNLRFSRQSFSLPGGHSPAGEIGGTLFYGQATLRSVLYIITPVSWGTAKARMRNSRTASTQGTAVGRTLLASARQFLSQWK